MASSIDVVQICGGVAGVTRMCIRRRLKTGRNFHLYRVHRQEERVVPAVVKVLNQSNRDQQLLYKHMMQELVERRPMMNPQTKTKMGMALTRMRTSSKRLA